MANPFGVDPAFGFENVIITFFNYIMGWLKGLVVFHIHFPGNIENIIWLTANICDGFEIKVNWKFINDVRFYY